MIRGQCKPGEKQKGMNMNPNHKMIDPEALIEAREFNTLREETKNWPSPDIAELMEPLSAEKEAVIFRLLPREQAADVFTYLSDERQEELLKAMAHEEVARILNAMDPDDRTALLEELPANVIQHMLNLLSPEERQVASQLLGYKEDSVGRLMTPDFVRIPHTPGWCATGRQNAASRGYALCDTTHRPGGT